MPLDLSLLFGGKSAQKDPSRNPQQNHPESVHQKISDTFPQIGQAKVCERDFAVIDPILWISVTLLSMEVSLASVCDCTACVGYMADKCCIFANRTAHFASLGDDPLWSPRIQESLRESGRFREKHGKATAQKVGGKV